jgi:hypothetical protein
MSVSGLRNWSSTGCVELVETTTVVVSLGSTVVVEVVSVVVEGGNGLAGNAKVFSSVV